MTQSPSQGLHGFPDPNRAVLVMSGSDARGILQDVVTNDVSGLGPGAAVYTALLTPQGKYLFDFFLFEGTDGTVLIDVARDRAAALAQRLGMYCLRRDAGITGVAPLQVALVWGAEPPRTEAFCLTDPRDAALGWRLYAGDAGAALDAAGIRRTDRAAYDSLRIAQAVPETGAELVPEDTYILEAGFERLNGVDFRKGCYVGQEVTARMKHKTELRKGLVQVRVNGSADPGTPVTANGKPAGTLYTNHDGRGLAHLRLDRAGEGMEAGTARVDYLP